MSLCKKPFNQGSLSYGCGQCLPCRINNRRLKTHRIMLETLKHNASCFLTLTYDDDHLPEYFAPDGALMKGTLLREDYQNFLKNLRYYIRPHKVRYHFVGEYGDESGRPHYHAALFGLGPSDQEVINASWKKGFAYVGDLTFQSAQYIAGYVTKKLTNKNDPRVLEILQGRLPEFGQTSLKPGLGATAMEDIVDKFMLTDIGANHLINTGDVPNSLKHGAKSFPLGRYLKGKLREMYGFEEKGTPKPILSALQMQMRDLLEEALSDPEGPSVGLAKLGETKQQKIRNLETRYSIYNTKGSL